MFGIVCAALLIPFYVLSVGPAVGIGDRILSRASNEAALEVDANVGHKRLKQAVAKRSAILALYHPVFWIAKHSSAFDEILNWYCTLWESPSDTRPRL